MYDLYFNFLYINRPNFTVNILLKMKCLNKKTVVCALYTF